MSLPLTPTILRAAYEYLRVTPPFKRWHLPLGEEVVFRVTRHGDREGDCLAERNRYIIRVSVRKIGHTDSLMALTGHEMIHVYQYMHGVRSFHNKEFHRLSALACKYHGWDERLFV